MRRVAVTGTSGFIGRHLVEYFEARGTGVVAVRRPFEPQALFDAMNGVDAVVHLAGVVSALQQVIFRCINW